MKLTVDGKNYIVRFEYANVEFVCGGSLDYDTTHCFIYDGDKYSTTKGKEKDKCLLASSYVARYYLDKQDKEKARKYAFAKTLDNLEKDKNKRRKFWNEYFKRDSRKVTERLIEE